MISCHEAQIICNKSQYNESTFLEKVRLKMHLLFCKSCFNYTKKNTKLTTLCSQAELKGLSTKDKQKMKQKIATDI